MKTILIHDVLYEIVRNDNKCIDKLNLDDIMTDYFDPFDYVLGDFSYDKVRLKGYYDSNHKHVKKYNDYKYIDDYIRDYCSVGCNIFIIKKVPDKKQK